MLTTMTALVAAAAYMLAGAVVAGLDCRLNGCRGGDISDVDPVVWALSMSLWPLVLTVWALRVLIALAKRIGGVR